jgi:hypothetical protein
MPIISDRLIETETPPPRYALRAPTRPAARGTYFWVDPKEEIVGVYTTQAPSPIRAYYRKMFKALVYQALVD